MDPREVFAKVMELETTGTDARHRAKRRESIRHDALAAIADGHPDARRLAQAACGRDPGHAAPAAAPNEQLFTRACMALLRLDDALLRAITFEAMTSVTETRGWRLTTQHEAPQKTGATYTCTSPGAAWCPNEVVFVPPNGVHDRLRHMVVWATKLASGRMGDSPPAVLVEAMTEAQRLAATRPATT